LAQEINKGRLFEPAFLLWLIRSSRVQQTNQLEPGFGWNLASLLPLFARAMPTL
jgi:hypothetical protein